jgi:putative PIN family toxin of toxin-antitoxin system
VRVVIDTNIWISALLNRTGAPARILAAWRAGRFTVIASAGLVAELEQVLLRPRIARKYKLTPEDLDLAMELRRRAELVKVGGSVRRCRDPKDDMLIETALLGNANFLVSRDEDLTRALDLVEHLAASGIQVLSVRRFLEIIDETEPTAPPQE